VPVTESPARLPGWTLIRGLQKGVRYRAPDGTEVGAWAYKTSLKQYEKTGVAPHSPAGTGWQRFQKERASSSRQSPVYEDLVAEIPVAGDESVLIELPETKPTSTGRTKAGLFNAKELSTGLQTVLILVTTLLAVALSLPEAQMTETEVKALSIPLGNIIERSKYNKTIGALIVDKSDYLTIGYVLYIYFDRVTTAAKEKKLGKPTGATPAPQQQPTPAGVGLNGATAPGVSLRVSPTGLRGITGNL